MKFSATASSHITYISLKTLSLSHLCYACLFIFILISGCFRVLSHHLTHATAHAASEAELLHVLHDFALDLRIIH